MVKIKRIGVLSCGKIFGTLYALLGVIFGAIMTVMSIILSFFSTSGPEKLASLFGIGAIVFVPILYGVMGYVLGLGMAFLYNLTTSWVGGLEVEVETEGVG